VKRAIATILVLVAAGAFVLLAGGARNDEGNNRYWVQLDNAFGLIEGADMKVAGVRAGKITALKIDRRAKKALVEFEVEQKPSFKALRADVRCESRPQSLIGEYFLDCQPGSSPRRLRPGSTIPVSQTQSTIPPDLVNNVLRLPQRERLRIILNEFGTGLAARGQDLNLAIRRGVPAIRETDKLLSILARQNQVIADLTANADTVITALANNRANVGRFVVEARDTAAASAERQADIRGSFNRLPRFLEELTPTMRELARAVDAQTPALRDLNASSGQLERFFKDLGPFAEASRPSFRSLGEASVVGRQAARAARPTVAELRRLTRHAPELGKNLAIVLEDLYDRNRAVEKDPRAPGENTGWNGLEALLGYVFWQSQAVNIFDRNGYILKVAVYDNECAPYQNAESVKADPAIYNKCKAQLGPNQPGVTTEDTSNPPGVQSRASGESTAQTRSDARVLAGANQAAGSAPGPGGGPGAAPPAAGPKLSKPKVPVDLGRTIDQVLGDLNLPVPNVGKRPTDQVLPSNTPAADGKTAGQLLDYLLGS
jgi:phospholipid/cholesterol/gamma-HCH transport system substrate-binding protein